MNANDLQDTPFETQPGNAEDLAQAGSTLSDKARAVKDSARQWSRQATDSTRKAAEVTDNYVHENPWAAIACAAIGCFLIGFLSGRRGD